MQRKSNSFRGRGSRPNNKFNSRPNNKFRSGGRPRTASRGPKKQTIHPSKFINQAAKLTEVAPYVPQHRFSDFALRDALKQNLATIGFDTPSAIQDQAIPLALEGKDVIGLANTGTGKTAAFLLPILSNLRDKQRNAVLIMAPTRELAQQIDAECKQQIDAECKRFSRGMKLYSTVVVGGTNIERQIRDLRRNPHIIIGTPGRLNDLLNRGALRLTDISVFVLDEADRMLDGLYKRHPSYRRPAAVTAPNIVL